MRQAESIIEIASALHRQERAASTDWDQITDWAPLAPNVARSEWTGLVDHWLKLTDVRPSLRLSGEKTDFALGSGTFGAFAVQLALAVGRGQSLAICTGCQTPYERVRAARNDRGNFCPECGEPVAAKLRKRRERGKPA